MASGTQPLPKKARLSMQRAEERRDEEHMKQSDLFVANNPELTPRRQSIHSGAGQMIDGHRLHNAAALRTPLRQPLLGPRGADNPPDCVRPSPGDL